MSHPQPWVSQPFGRFGDPAEALFDHKVAERDLRRYRRRGPDATTRHILAELRRWPLEGRRLLDVGGGIGGHQRGTRQCQYGRRGNPTLESQISFVDYGIRKSTVTCREGDNPLRDFRFCFGLKL